jgi:NAD(P)-dependent dehydrogenase (short-subunit alcohol dehydrogenase family)
MTTESAEHMRGKAAFITGAARGLSSRALVERGARAALDDLDEGEATRRAEALGEGALAVACDLADETSVHAAVTETPARLGGVGPPGQRCRTAFRGVQPAVRGAG